MIRGMETVTVAEMTGTETGTGRKAGEEEGYISEFWCSNETESRSVYVCL